MGAKLCVFVQRPPQRLRGCRSGGACEPHPDANQERFCFGLLKECLGHGSVSEDLLLRAEMRRNHIRRDAVRVLERTPSLAA